MDYGQPLQFGVSLTPLNDDPRGPVALAQLAESVGLDIVTVQDHPYQPRFHETWTLLSWIAGSTSRISLAPNVLNVPMRLPAVVARSAASLDLLSGGRRPSAWYESNRARVGLMQAAGLTNVFADIDDTWTSASWEAVAEKNPDVIVLIASPGNTIEDKIALLQADPVMSTLDAVVNERFVTLDFAAAEAGVRNVDAVASLVRQLDAL